MERKKLINELLQIFSTKLNETLQPFQNVSEKIDYLETLIEYISGVYYHVHAIPHLGWEGNPFDSEGFIRKNILAKFKDKARPFIDTEFRYYLERKPEDRTYLFQLLKLNGPILNEQEFELYIRAVNHIIQNLIEKACIDSSSDDDADTNDTNELGHINGYSRSRQVLMLFYLLEIAHLGRKVNSLPKVAEFSHALLNLPTKNFNTSALNKMLKTAPLLKQNEVSMLQDLEFVKAKFILLGSSEAVELIQKQINSIKQS